MPTNQRKRRLLVKQVTLLVAFLLAVSFGWYKYSERVQDRGLVSGTFLSASGKESSPFEFEVAANNSERARGLMFRKELPSDRGMIFVFPDESKRTFWMKDTYLSLDMLFLDRNRKVVGLLEKVPVLNTTPRGVDSPSKYVVELVAGTAQKQGIQTGSILKLRDELPSPR